MKIGLIGFFGAGNIGDEAMLLALAGYLAKHTLTVFTGEKNEDSLRLHEENNLTRAGWNEVKRIADQDLVILGGGSLGPGFGWQLIPQALNQRIPVVSVGMSFGGEWLADSRPAAAALYRSMLRCFTKIIVRDRAGLDTLQSIGIPAELGTDLAVLLRCAPVERSDAPLLFVRHPDLADRRELTIHLTEEVLAEFPNADLGCCAPADLRFANEALPEISGAVWPFSDPRDCLRRCKAAPRVITIGRLHPAVLAASVGTPCLAATTRIDKIPFVCSELGTVVYDGEDMKEWRELLQKPIMPLDVEPLRRRMLRALKTLPIR